MWLIAVTLGITQKVIFHGCGRFHRTEVFSREEATGSTSRRNENPHRLWGTMKKSRIQSGSSTELDFPNCKSPLLRNVTDVSLLYVLGNFHTVA